MAMEALEGFTIYLNTIETKLREYYSACENEKMVSAAIDKEIDEVLIPRLKEVAALDIQRGGKPNMTFTTKSCGSKKRPVLILNGLIFASAEALDGETKIIEKLNLLQTDRAVMDIAKELYGFIEEVKEKEYWEILLKYAPDKKYDGVKEFLDTLPSVINRENITYEVVTEKFIAIRCNKTSRDDNNGLVNMAVGDWFAQNGRDVKIEGNTLMINGNVCKDMELSLRFKRKDTKEYYQLESVAVNTFFEDSMYQEVLELNVIEDRRPFEAKLNPQDTGKISEYVTDVIYGDGEYATQQYKIYKAKERAELDALD